MSTSTSLAAAAVQLPQHLVASPWMTFARSDYFDCLGLETPAPSDDDDLAGSDSDSDDDCVRPYKAFPITPPPAVEPSLASSFKLSLPTFPFGASTGARRSSSTSALFDSRRRPVPLLTPPTSPPFGRPHVSPFSQQQRPSKADVHKDTPRPISPHRERSWEGYFARPAVALELVRQQSKAIAIEPDGEWEVESVQLWLRH